MKLHLPKQLFTALLAAITLAAPAVKGADGDSTATITYSGTTYTWGGENNNNTYHSGPFTADNGNTATWQTSSQNNNTIKFTAASNNNYESAGFQFSGFSVGGFIVEEGADINLLYAANGSTVTSEIGRDITIGKNANEISGTTIKDDFEIKSCGGTIAIGGSQQVWEVEEGNTYTVNSGSGAITNNCADLVIRSIATADTADSPGVVILKGAFTNNGTMTVNSGATLTLSSTFTNNGTMTVNGNIAISSGSLSNFDRSFDDSSYTTSGSQTVDILCTLYKGNAINGVTSVTLDSESKNLNEKGQFVVSQTAYVVADNDTVTVGGSSPTEGAGNAALFALADTGTLEFAATQSGNLVKEVVGNGRVVVTLETPTSGGHNRGVKLGSNFHGTLAVNSGWMDLTTFTTAADATLELHAGQHWSNGGTLTQNIDLKATAADEYVFRNSATLALTGTVTGDYLNVGTTGNNGTIVELTNSQNKISHAVVGCSNNAATLKLSADMSFDSITTHSNSKVVLTEGKTLSLTDGESSISTIEASGATINLAEGVTLNIGSDSTASTSTIGTIAASGNTIHLNNKATLDRLSSVTGTVTLSGSGKYALGNSNTLTSGVTLADDTWKGTLVYSNAAKDNNIIANVTTLAGLSTSDKAVQISGTIGYLNTGANNALGVDIALENPTDGYALTIANGNSNKTAIISGAVSGTGDIAFNPQYYSNNTWGWENVKYQFSGNIADWTGNFIFQNTTTDATDVLTVIFSDNATSIHANLINNNMVDADNGISRANASDKFNLEITNTQKVDVYGTVDVDKVTVTNTGETNFHSSLKAATVELGTAATITGKDSGTVSMAKVKMNATGISSADTTGATKGSISNAQLTQLQAGTSFTIQDMTLDNTTITAATSTTQVKLQNVEATNLALAQGKFTMSVAPTVGMDGTTAEFGSGVVSLLAVGSASLTLNMDVIGAYESTGAMDDVTLTITLAGITGDVSGYGVDDWKALVGFEENSWLGRALTGAQYTVSDVAPAAEGGVPSVNYGYAATGGDGSNVGTLVITINGLNVPEPASATLGLAALMMLCARRRRKA